MSEKSIKAKPQFYAVCLHPLQEIAKGLGYNLVVHGSMNRDLDLIAIPWIDNPHSEIKLIQTIDMYLRGICYEDNNAKEGYMFSTLSGGRNNYVINLNRSNKWNNYTDEQYYLDISITPLSLTNHEKIN